MRNRRMMLTACCVAAMLAGMGSLTAGATETEQTIDRSGELTFAQCEEYINVRSSASTDAEVVAKIYNNDSATILEEDGEWFKIQSGNAVGYVKSEYFATGDEAAAIAEEVAYNVAAVHPEHLNVRMEPTEDSGLVTVAHQEEELEVVASEGDWMKVALGDDVYGYVNSYFVEYKTYYPTAETIEEEQARLAAEAAWAETEPQYTETEPEYTETEPEYTETEPEYTETEPQYTETEPEYTETEPEYTETEPEYTETEPEYTETEPQYTETEPEYTETEPQYTETEPEYTETEAPQTEAPDSSTGQQIVDYAMQFIGNPYVWGGTSLTSGADCSGFTQSVFANFGIGLARVAADQSYGGTAVDIGSILPGDLLFYSDGTGISHVAIYAGGGMIVHASNPTSGITTSNYDYSTPVAARRYW